MPLPLPYNHPPFTSKARPDGSRFLFPYPCSRTLFFRSSKHCKFVIRSSTADVETVSKTAIQRIAEKLRSLGYVEENSEDAVQPEVGHGSAGEIFIPFPNELPKHRVGYTIDSSWSTPENPVPEPGSGPAITRFHELKSEVRKQKRAVKKEEKVPTLAELTIPQEELKRLRGIGICLREKLKVGKAGITEGIVNGIHERWRHSELVKIMCEDLCKMNMKRTHDILERKTGGFVVWRSGSTIILYRGANYKYPYFFTNNSRNVASRDMSLLESSMDCGAVDGNKSDSVCIYASESAQPSVSSMRGVAQSPLIHGVGSPNRVRFQLPGEAQLAEEADRMLDGLGPRFTDWWGYDPLPVDADLLPAVVPGYRRPFRLLPYGVKPKLTNDEMTTLRRLGRPLPCHFALGRNRNLQGLAVSMVKLWERCELAKIAVKRGVQNVNSDMMAEELKRLTGGMLLSRDREFIVFYRGKDFLPSRISSEIEERKNYGMHGGKQKTGDILSREIETTTESNLQTVEQASVVEPKRTSDLNKINHSSEQRKLRSAMTDIRTINSKLSVALEKKEKAEKLLIELEKAATPQKPELDKEGITEEERYMLRKVGLRMKPFLLLGRRGVFDGTVENMHLHWKYRELVKIISSDRCIEDVHAKARTLEAESGGILVAVERVSKGYAIIVYRGKNYRRPTSLRPRTLLNKKEAMRRSLEAQRRESLKLHVLKLNGDIDQLKLKSVKDNKETTSVHPTEYKKSDSVLETSDHACSENFAHDQENAEVIEGNGDVSASFQSNDGMSNSNETTWQDKRLIFSSHHEEEVAETEFEPLSASRLKQNSSNASLKEVYDKADHENASNPECGLDKRLIFSSNCEEDVAETELEPLSESILKQNSSNASLEEVYDKADNENTSIPDCGLTRDPSVESTRRKPESSIKKDLEKGSSGVPFRAAPLSNNERLLLRKQALKMKRRPVLAVGKSNVITGVATTIKTHFRKHPLAIVNVKGRAKGTSVQEIVFKLEQATGAVLVSQEPSKIILYRGWIDGEEPYGTKENKSDSRKRSASGAIRQEVSPQLMAAIRLECGLESNKEEKATL